MDPEKVDTCLMNLEKYSQDKFGLFIDLRSFSDNAFHGSGIKVMNTKDGIQLQIKKTGTTACQAYIFLLADAMLSIQNGRLKSVAYWDNYLFENIFLRVPPGENILIICFSS